MSWPYGLNLTTVTGNFADVSGMVPSAITVTFGPAAVLWRGQPATPLPVTDAGGHVVLTAEPVCVRANSGGSFSVDLVATDNEGLVPVNWLYVVTLTSGSQPPQTFTALLPHSPDTVDFSHLVNSPGGVAQYGYLSTAGGPVSGTVEARRLPAAADPGRHRGRRPGQRRVRQPDLGHTERGGPGNGVRA